MGDLAYLNLLREKVRHFEEEQNRAAVFGASRAPTFVPWVLPVHHAGGGDHRVNASAAAGTRGVTV